MLLKTIPILLVFSLCFAPLASAGAGSADLVEIGAVAPGVKVELRYATTDNFTGRVVYDCGRCFLRKGTAEKVAAAQRMLVKSGLSLKVWDCYRPLSVQKIFWSLVPDPRYVADPKTGSRHNRGTAVDVTLVDARGKELAMPTPFDDFSPRASHLFNDLPPQVIRNREFLAGTMRAAGFRPLADEWWHYDDPEGKGETLDVPFSDLCRDGRK